MSPLAVADFSPFTVAFVPISGTVTLTVWSLVLNVCVYGKLFAVLIQVSNATRLVFSLMSLESKVKDTVTVPFGVSGVKTVSAVTLRRFR